MIEIRYLDFKWGIDALEDGGAKINILDEDSKTIHLIPFDAESLPFVAAELYRFLDDEQKAAFEKHLADREAVDGEAHEDHDGEIHGGH